MDVFFSPRFLFHFFHPFRKSKDKRGAAATTGFSFSFFLSFTRNIDAIRSLVRQRKSKAIILNTARESRFSQFLTFFLSLSLFLSLCLCVYNLRPKSTLRLRVQNDLLISRVRLFVISPPRKRVIQKKIRNDKESYALGHGKSRRWRRRWYSRNWHTEYVLLSFACIVSSVRVCID